MDVSELKQLLVYSDFLLGLEVFSSVESSVELTSCGSIGDGSEDWVPLLFT